MSWWNTLKLKTLSYGVTSNNSISNTAAYPTLSAEIMQVLGYKANSLGNADLGWEKNT